MVVAPVRDVHCWSEKPCMPDGKRKLLFRVEAGSKGTIFHKCPCCGSLNVVVLDKMQ